MGTSTELYIGLMSGTSIDGVDVAIVDFSDGKPKLIHWLLHPIDAELKHRLAEISSVGKEINHPIISNENSDLIEYTAELDVKIGQLFAEAVNRVLAQNKIDAKQIKAIGSHGQTIRHRPNNGFPFSIQIGDPNVIAENTGITTVADFRRADIAAGGQGAPLAPAFHNAVLRSNNQNRVILNLGGIANITLLAKDQTKPVIGFDTGPANTLMDAWFVKHHPESNDDFDRNAQFALQGKVSARLLETLLDEPYFSQPIPKSTGREYFSMAWLKQKLDLNQQQLSPADIQRTLLEFTVASISNAIEQQPIDDFQLLTCGGGMHNPLLMQQLTDRLNCSVIQTDEVGVSGDYLEAMTFAWLARQRLLQLPGNLPSVTGAKKEKVLGAIYLANS